MRLRLTKLDEFQFLTCVKHELWGSKKRRFDDWQTGDHLALIVNKAIAGLAEVMGEPFVSQKRVWDNDVFPHRIPVKFKHVMRPENRPPILGDIRDALMSEWGRNYGWGILNQRPVSGEPAKAIVRAIGDCHDDLRDIRANIEQYLTEAQADRDAAAVAPRKRRRKITVSDEGRAEEQATVSKREESAHSRCQSGLIRLGKTTGCSVWIASNDRNRTYRGKRLGEGCLEALPSLGLSDEATRRISLIDVIWIRQSAPVCAFEVETSTSIYSGLLRMSDLLSVVPALNIRLYIVAPRTRQNRVLAELARPTFHRIGLSDYCQFIPAEELHSLLERVGNLGGHVQPSVLETVGVALDTEDEGGSV